MDSLNLVGHTAVVFGGNGNIGSVIVEKLFRNGAQVVLSYYIGEEEAAGRHAAALDPTGKSIITVFGDITDEDSVKAVYAKALEAFGSVDIVVDSVEHPFDPLFVSDIEWKDWALHIGAQKGLFLVCKHALPIMRENKFGRIIYLSAALGVRYMAGCAPFATTKSGLIGFCRTLAMEEGKNNITVNIVCPGKITVTATQDQNQWDEISEDLMKHTPMGHFAKAADVADTVLFFASPLADTMTGQILYPSCGEVMR